MPFTCLTDRRPSDDAVRQLEKDKDTKAVAEEINVTQRHRAAAVGRIQQDRFDITSSSLQDGQQISHRPTRKSIWY